MKAEAILFSLLRHVICGQPMDDKVKEACTAENLRTVCELAQKHDILHWIAYGLEKWDLPHSNILTELRTAKTNAIARYMRQDYEFSRICGALEQARIPYIPLKGSVLRAHYPEPWMRNSCDIDILVEEFRLDDAVETLCTGLGYRAARKGDHDVSLFSSTGVCLELHYDTVQRRYANDTRRAILGRIWAVSAPETAGGFKHRMPDDMFCFYHFAHMAKHFESGGCGVRSVLDVWIMNHRMPAERESRNRLLEEGGLLAFADAIEKLSEVWFSESPEDPLTGQVGAYILTGGVFGNKENRAAVGQVKSGGTLRYLLTRRVFLPYDYLKAEYPVLKKRKWLTPVYQVARWLRMLRSGAVIRYFREILVNMGTKEDTRDATALMLERLGL